MDADDSEDQHEDEVHVPNPSIPDENPTPSSSSASWRAAPVSAFLASFQEEDEINEDLPGEASSSEDDDNNTGAYFAFPQSRPNLATVTADNELQREPNAKGNVPVLDLSSDSEDDAPRRKSKRFKELPFMDRMNKEVVPGLSNGGQEDIEVLGEHNPRDNVPVLDLSSDPEDHAPKRRSKRVKEIPFMGTKRKKKKRPSTDSVVTRESQANSSSRPQDWNCEPCGKTFKLKKTFLFHLNRYHGKSCEFCGIRPIGFKSHMKRYHPNQSCRFCRKIFRDFKELSRHVSEAHGEDATEKKRGPGRPRKSEVSSSSKNDLGKGKERAPAHEIMSPKPERKELKENNGKEVREEEEGLPVIFEPKFPLKQKNSTDLVSSTSDSEWSENETFASGKRKKGKQSCFKIDKVRIENKGKEKKSKFQIT